MKPVTLHRMVLAFISTLAAGCAALVAATPADPLPSREIEALAVRLNEAAAVGVPHGFLMAKADRLENAALLTKVEAGAELDAAETRAYRFLIQKTLAANQGFLGAFDRQLTLAEDICAGEANNAGGSGIAGQHDHHDLSAQRNAARIEACLDMTEREGVLSSPLRIAGAACAWKHAADLIGHLAVGAHSVGAASIPSGEGKSPEVAAMIAAYKIAQFAPVNSARYWRAVVDGEAAYGALLARIRQTIVARLSPPERRIAGPFLSLRQLAPQIDRDLPLRPRR